MYRALKICVCIVLSLLVAACGGGGASMPAMQSASVPSGAITRKQPQGLGLGRELYVLNIYEAQPPVGVYQILVFDDAKFGNVAPVRVITSPFFQFPNGVGGPYALAVDAAGYLYVLNGPFGGPDFILVFPPGAGLNAMPVRIIAGSNTKMQFPFTIDIDLLGRVYVAEDYNKTLGVILGFGTNVNGNVSPITALLPKPGLPNQESVISARVGLAYEFAAMEDLTNTHHIKVEMFPLGSTGVKAPFCAMTGSNLDYITGYGGGNAIMAKAPGIPLWLGLYQPTQQSPVPNQQALYAFNNCNSNPVGIISGQNTQINRVVDLTVDLSGRLFELDAVSTFSGFAAINEWGPGNQNGNVAPSHVIAGPNTGLTYPIAITIGPNSALTP